ncbi:MAG: hypothetical protein ACLU4N_18525 [Butyricimonas faecihominis]
MSLFTPEFGLVFWMLVVFLILFGILAKYAWPAIVRMMDERADFIDKGVEYAGRLKEIVKGTRGCQRFATRKQIRRYCSRQNG